MKLWGRPFLRMFHLFVSLFVKSLLCMVYTAHCTGTIAKPKHCKEKNKATRSCGGGEKKMSPTL